MTQIARTRVVVDGGQQAVQTLDEVAAAHERIGKSSKSTAVRLKELRGLWEDPAKAKGWSQSQRLFATIGKGAAEIVGKQVADAASAIAAPAKTSYDQALAKANAYRDATQRIATSTGKGYEQVSSQINASAQRLGLLPGRVQDYSRSVRTLTGDWEGAMSGLDAYQNRALKTDRTLEEMIPTAATLAQTFGVKSTEDVNKFFGTLDRQAKNAGVSAEIAERAFLSASGMLSSLTSARPQQLGALTTAVMGGAPTAAMGESRIGAIGGLLGGHTRYLEARMRSQGKLGKGEHIYDEQGQIRGDKLFDTLEFAQKDLAKFYGTKDRKELIGRISQSGMMSMQDAAGILGLDVSTLRTEAGKSTAAADATTGFLGSGAGKRALGEARKDIKDIGLGTTMLGAQDLAVSAGGGAAGIAIASAGQLFSKATDVFWSAVNIFAGKSGGGVGGVGGVAATAGGSAVGASAPKAVGALARLGPWGLLAAGALVAGVGTYYAAGENEKEEERKKQEREAAARQGFTDVTSARFIRSRFHLPEPGEPITETGRGADADHPLNLGGSGLSSRELADLLAKAIAGQTLRVQAVTLPAAPQGQPQPL